MNYSTTHHHHAGRGLAQSFGLHPAVAALTLTLDTMLWGAEVGTLGLSLPISLGVSGALGVIAYRAQKSWYGDEDESAKLKAWIIALLMAIPTGLPAALYLPWGFAGFFRRRQPEPTIYPAPADPAPPSMGNGEPENKSKAVSLPFYC